MREVASKGFIVTKRPRLAAKSIRRFAFSDTSGACKDAVHPAVNLRSLPFRTSDGGLRIEDGQGRSGIVRRLGWAMDPRSFTVYPIAAPLPHEKGKHYLQRFWEKLPDPGQIVVFDRSWYGRVLVERVEGFATKREWQRAYEEINQFERIMVADGIRLPNLSYPPRTSSSVRDRLTNPSNGGSSHMRLRNRSRWADYEVAIGTCWKLINKWFLVPSNDKRYGRRNVFTVLVGLLGREFAKPRPRSKIADMARQLFDLPS